MAVNSFIAALGNILEGASSDRERTRKLKELEEEREYTRLERRQLAEDRAERRAREKQAEADRLEALGYESETVLKSRLAGLGDAPAYEPGAASFDLGMDGVASKPAGTSLKPSPFSGSRLGVIGQDPFGGAKAQGMVEGADKAEQRRETQRRLASLVDVAGQGRMYATTRAQQLAAEEQRLAGVTDRATEREREKKRIDAQVVEKQTEEARAKVIANATKFLSPEDLKALEGGVPLESLIVSKTDRAKINATLAAAARQSLPSVSERRAGGLYSGAQTALGALEKLVEDGYSPLKEGYASRGAAAVGLGAVSRGLASTKGKLFRNEVERLITNYLYVTTGATSTAEEVANQARQTTTDILDGPETFDQKMNFLRGKVGEMKIISGRAAPDSLDEADLYGGVSLIRKPR